MVFDTGGLGAGTVSSATLTMTPTQAGPYYQRAGINVGLNFFLDDNMGTLPHGYNANNNYTGYNNTNPITVGTSWRYPHIGNPVQIDENNVDFCLEPRRRVDSRGNSYNTAWQVGTPVSFDVTRQVNGYFANPHRVNCTEIFLQLELINDGNYTNNGWRFGDSRSATPPTLEINHTPLTRTNIAGATGNIGNYTHTNASVSARPENSTLLSTDYFYSYHDAGIGWYSTYQDVKGFMYFPVANEIQQGEQVTKAYLSYAQGGTTNYGKSNSKKIYGDKTGTTGKLASYSDFTNKTLTTNFVNQGDGKAPNGNFHQNQSILDVTDVVNEIVADPNWDGNGIQFLSGKSGDPYSTKMTPYLNKTTNTLMYPTLSLFG